MKEFIKKNYKAVISLLLVIAIGAIGLTLAYAPDEPINVGVGTGNYAVVYTGEATLPETVLQPVYDSVVTIGLIDADASVDTNVGKVMAVEFTVKGAETNSTDVPIIYDVSLTNLDIPTELQHRLLKWRLYKNGGSTPISEGSFSKQFDAQANDRMVLTEIQQDLPSYDDTADSYVFYIWISEECTGDISLCTDDMDTEPLMNKSFSGEIRIELSTKGKKTIDRITGDGINTVISLGLESSIKEGIPDFTKTSPYLATYKETITTTPQSNSLNSTRSQYYVTYADTYTFNKESGTYSLVNAVVGQYPSVYSNLTDKYIISYSLSDSSTIASYTNRGTIYKVTEATYDSSSLTGVIKYVTLGKTEDQYDYSETGIYKAKDDLGTSYYFRGAVENNYVKFGKNDSGNDMYWRIIRINGDGTIRMIYDGTSAYANGVSTSDKSISTSVFNSSYNNNAYVGYMYGNPSASTYIEVHTNTTDSVIKDYLENTWYIANIKDTDYEQYVADAIYCNDRSLDTSSSSYTAVGTVKTNYAAYQRLRTNSEPILICSQKNDRFTSKSTSISGVDTTDKLASPIGLITADEVVMAGGKYNASNTLNYLYSGNRYWTMSPAYFTSPYAYLFVVDSGSTLNYLSVNGASTGIRPVISLKADAIKSGKGTITEPFLVE